MKDFSHNRRALPATPSPQRVRSARLTKENVDPMGISQPEYSPFRSPLTVMTRPLSVKNRSPLPPRPPSHKPPTSTPLKRKLEMIPAEDGPTLPKSSLSDTGVQVVVRLRPPSGEEGVEQVVQKISSNSVSVFDQLFTFDSVVDTSAKQEDIFTLLGIPLVENCLAGFNSSIFAYGQTGSGKTYTMWGPSSSLSADETLGDERGLTPRVFELLFARIEEEQTKHLDKQLHYQCHCSFLEIYNEQITDLLDPNQRNLQIREDVRSGVYVEYLTEEPVCSTRDVMQLLIKGLANRRTGATSVNAESSRSHCVFTCVIESRSKSTTDGLNTLRISRINLVDLAGSERQKLTGAAGDRLKEAGNINRSLSHLGNLIYILAEISQSGRKRHIPYRDSKLTFLLQESLGGNAKLAMICAISPSQSCMNETIITLKFAQRAKAIKNKAVVNEVMQDDVRVLREQIRQLKDELHRMKTNEVTTANTGSFSTGWNARRSLNLLRLSLQRPAALPELKEDSDEEMEIDENDVEQPVSDAVTLSNSVGTVPSHLENLNSLNSNTEPSFDSNMHLADTTPMCTSLSRCLTEPSRQMSVATEKCPKIEETQQSPLYESAHWVGNSYREMASPISSAIIPDAFTAKMEEGEEATILADVLNKSVPFNRKPIECSKSAVDVNEPADASPIYPSNTLSSQFPAASNSCLGIVPCESAPLLASPSLGVSPRVSNSSRKSLRASSAMSVSKKDILENAEPDEGVLKSSFADPLKDDTCACKDVSVPKERLAASLQWGLQIIGSGLKNPTLRQSSFRFSMKPRDLKALMPVQKVNIGVQTVLHEANLSENTALVTCTFCQNKAPQVEDKNINNDKNMQLVPVDSSPAADKHKNPVPKAVEKVLAGAIRREMALEDLCTKQASEIAQLNRLVQQYKHERECNAIIEQTREDKISRLESLMDGLPAEDFMEEELISLRTEYKLLKEKYENHPDVLYANIELRRVQNELDAYKNFHDLGERDILIEEVQDLRKQLRRYVDTSMSTRKLRAVLHLADSAGPVPSSLGAIPELSKENIDENIEEERRQWVETESKLISLCEDLRVELESCRSLAGKKELELEYEKKCREELKEALETAMMGHARILELYADLEEKHINLLGRHRQIRDGLADMKRAATRAGLKSAESKIIESLTAEISAMKAEREKERKFWRGENKGLKTQLSDTAEAVEAAGELLVRLKEAEEVAANAKKRALLAEEETEKAYQEIDNLKENFEKEIVLLNQLLAESRLPKEAMLPISNDVHVVKCDESLYGKKWKGEMQPCSQAGESGYDSENEPPSWFSGYDRCNI